MGSILQKKCRYGTFARVVSERYSLPREISFVATARWRWEAPLPGSNRHTSDSRSRQADSTALPTLRSAPAGLLSASHSKASSISSDLEIVPETKMSFLSVVVLLAWNPLEYSRFQFQLGLHECLGGGRTDIGLREKRVINHLHKNLNPISVRPPPRHSCKPNWNWRREYSSSFYPNVFIGKKMVIECISRIYIGWNLRQLHHLMDLSVKLWFIIQFISPSRQTVTRGVAIKMISKKYAFWTA